MQKYIGRDFVYLFLMFMQFKDREALTTNIYIS